MEKMVLKMSQSKSIISEGFPLAITGSLASLADNFGIGYYIIIIL